MAPGSPPSNARATSCMPLVTKFSQSNCTARSGKGNPAKIDARKRIISAAPVEINR
jgi:hypothetical protein